MKARARLLAPALLVTFVFYVLADARLGYETPGFAYVYAWVAIGALTLLAAGFILRRIPDRWVHPACAALLWCSSSSTLVTLSFTPTPGPVFLLMIQVASAGILLHSGWAIATVGATTLAAAPILSALPGVPALMGISALVTAASFALLIHLILHGTTVRIISLQFAEAATARALQQQLVEAERLQSQLMHAQRMEAVGTLAAGLAHDMNNVLGSISNLAELVVERARSDQRDDLQQIIVHASRGAELTRGLLAFSRRGQYRKRPISLERLVGDVLPLLQRMLPKSIEIRDHLACGDVWVDGDPVHLAQVMMNLALNAADAMSGTGVIDIAVSRTEAGDGRPRVRIEVRDTGQGMDAATQLRAFEPFFTTKPIGKGSGLGLSVVWGIVQAHDGRIEVRSQPGAGTTFIVELPTTVARPADEHEPVAARTAPARATVLVVDDEAALRETTRRLLVRMGLDVVVAQNGEEALAVYAEHAAAIRLVVLDMGMPVMGGAECFARLRAHSDVPVLISTGYADDEQVRELIAAGAQIVEKPFTAAQLREQVTSLVDVAPPLAAAN